ncbi:DUF3140 domain-containing protein [Streptomyces sp. SL13]|uniref:DUF3140 domain-containing protein n=1 Tax=Streptantibioticus silvisoli TaxID=2705255 RepID=A0AA90GWL8_9ACTN|nr:DUF3140 domain-containing protein [Streptantibioticus silvisoli]MDI5962603.1 DUF3140 domain-containing protein [Streptantibioticus silvisoli]MDI5969234.1 DUF3140 domain-containing protein [Streptantibioticus silvisoli]
MTDTPDGISVLELDALWEEFHQVVNMTSMELGAWLGALPDGTDTGEGERVLAILHKRRADLTGEDISTMYAVVDQVEADPDGTDPDIRRGELMALGHDPTKTA